MFRLILLCVAALLPLLTSGCTLFAPVEEEVITERKRLKELTSTRDAVQLEILFAEQPPGELLIDHEIWQEVDQITALKPTVRTQLQKHGFRLGVGGAAPGRHLQRLLEMERVGDSSAVGVATPKMLLPQRITRRPGEETQVEASGTVESLTVRLPGVGRLPGELRTFRNARCVFRVEVKSLQEGWAKLLIVPEIHHGENQTRRVATTAGFTIKSSQEVERLYPLRFELDLSVGEMVMISRTALEQELDKDAVGPQFFRSERDGGELQKLLVIRLAETDVKERVFVER